VANKQSWAQQAGATPGKLALVGLLAVVLLGVLYSKYGGTKNDGVTVQTAQPTVPPPAPRLPSTPAPKTVDNVSVPTPPASEPRKKTGATDNWQSPELASVVDYDPFRLQTSLRQADRDWELAQLAAQKAKVAAERAKQLKDAALAKMAALEQAERDRLAAIETERKASESELQGLQKQGVGVIIKKKEEFVAMVGDQEVRVGDEINGFTVIAIDANGVQLVKELRP
jgi:hypothetical protein